MYSASLTATVVALTIPLPQLDNDHGYRGPGGYLLPLTRLPGEKYRITLLPAVPGFVPPDNDARIYPATEDVLAQARQILP